MRKQKKPRNEPSLIKRTRIRLIVAALNGEFGEEAQKLACEILDRVTGKKRADSEGRCMEMLKVQTHDGQ